MTTARVIDLPSSRARLEVLVEGDRVDVLLLPSAMRAASDFTDLASRLHRAGWGSAGVNPPGVGASGPPSDALTLRDVAGDLAHLVDVLADGPVHIVGHALGNTFARATAAYHPDRVRSVVLLACGGHNLAGTRSAPDGDTMAHFSRCHDPLASEDDRLASLAKVFFAAGNDPLPWLDGWWPGSGVLSAALYRGDPAEWATAGASPVLIVQPTGDVMAPPSVGRELARSIGGRARYVEVPRCGHAILPEQPDLVAGHVIRFFEEIERPPGRSGGARLGE